jgi:hypothetical protein
MKIRHILSLLAMVLALGAAFTGCEMEDDSGNAVTIATEISGIPVPAIGGKPVFNIEDTQYRGTVMWTPSVSETFAAGTEYMATIMLTPKEGYTFQGISANFFKIVGAPMATVTNAANSGVITVKFPANVGITTVNISGINGVTAPNIGARPVSAITETAQYGGTVTWSPTVSGTFAAEVYTAIITLNVKQGYTLEGVSANYFNVPGATTTNDANSGLIAAVFPRATSASTVSISGIEGVTAPVTGARPVTVITDNAQYSGMITWTPSVTGTFAAGTAYTAAITLTTKTGYTLEGVRANFFNVPGATASNAANSGVISARFPATVITTVSNAAVGGVTAPAAGANPKLEITENAQYRGTISWSPAVTGTFAGGSVYIATITLTAKPGYTLQGVPANFFTVAGAAASNAANSGVITALFPPATGISVVSIKAIEGLTPPATGVSPVTAITANAQYSGKVVWESNPDFTGSFVTNTIYTAYIMLTAKTGYTLKGLRADFFTVAGADEVTFDAATGVIKVEFPAAKSTISEIDIASVKAPVAGEEPVTVFSDMTEYSGKVSWSPALSDGKFKLAEIYTATITLEAVSNYTLYGVTQDFFTVGDVKGSNAANKGVVTVRFPAAEIVIDVWANAYTKINDLATSIGSKDYTVRFAIIPEDILNIYNENFPGTGRVTVTTTDKDDIVFKYGVHIRRSKVTLEGVIIKIDDVNKAAQYLVSGDPDTPLIGIAGDPAAVLISDRYVYQVENQDAAHPAAKKYNEYLSYQTINNVEINNCTISFIYNTKVDKALNGIISDVYTAGRTTGPQGTRVKINKTNVTVTNGTGTGTAIGTSYCYQGGACEMKESVFTCSRVAAMFVSLFGYKQGDVTVDEITEFVSTYTPSATPANYCAVRIDINNWEYQDENNYYKGLMNGTFGHNSQTSHTFSSLPEEYKTLIKSLFPRIGSGSTTQKVRLVDWKIWWDVGKNASNFNNGNTYLTDTVDYKWINNDDDVEVDYI